MAAPYASNVDRLFEAERSRELDADSRNNATADRNLRAQALAMQAQAEGGRLGLGHRQLSEESSARQNELILRALSLNEQQANVNRQFDLEKTKLKQDADRFDQTLGFQKSESAARNALMERQLGIASDPLKNPQTAMPVYESALATSDINDQATRAADVANILLRKKTEGWHLRNVFGNLGLTQTTKNPEYIVQSAMPDIVASLGPEAVQMLQLVKNPDGSLSFAPRVKRSLLDVLRPQSALPGPAQAQPAMPLSLQQAVPGSGQGTNMPSMPRIVNVQTPDGRVWPVPEANVQVAMSRYPGSKIVP